MTAIPFSLIVFRHERQTLAVLVGDLLGAVLVDDVVVAGDQRVGVAETDFLLPPVAFAFDGFEAQTGAEHSLPDVAQQRLHPRRRRDRVVDVVVAGRGQPAVAAGPRLAIGLVEHDEFELGGDIGGQAAFGQPVELAAQDRPRRHGDGTAVGPAHVGDHQRRTGQPWDAPQGGQVGPGHGVAVAGVPARHRITAHGVHVDVDGEQIAAALGAVGGHVVDEQPGVDPLADQPALHVGERHDDGVHLAGADQSFERGQRQHRSHPDRSQRVLHWPRPSVNQALPATGAQNDLGGQLRRRLLHAAPPQVHHRGNRRRRSAGWPGPPPGRPAS